MAEYFGRTGSCTAGSKYPDHNLTAYAKEIGQETAILGVVFGNNGEVQRKIYSYWGHTGCKTGHYVKVLVPRASDQEEVAVKIVSVLPATGIKEDSVYTCKHMQEYIGARPRNIPYIRSPPPQLLERWRNGMCAALLPMPKTKHAKNAVDTIDELLAQNEAHRPKEDRIDAIMCGVDLANGDHQLDGLLFGHMDTMTISREELKRRYPTTPLANADFGELEARVLAGLDFKAAQDSADEWRRKAGKQMHERWAALMTNPPKDFNQWLLGEFKLYAQHNTPPPSAKLHHEFDRDYQWYVSQKMLSFESIGSTRTRVTGDNSAKVFGDELVAYLDHERELHKRDESLQRSKLNKLGTKPTGRLRMSEMPVLGYGSCMAGKTIDSVIVDELYQNIPNQPKETTVSAKIETITYVTLPNNTRRDAKSLSADEFFDAIAALEKQVAKYEGIDNKPRALQERIDDTKKQITELSALCDTLYAAKTKPSISMDKAYSDGSTKGQSYGAGDTDPGSQA